MLFIFADKLLGMLVGYDASRNQFTLSTSRGFGLDALDHVKPMCSDRSSPTKDRSRGTQCKAKDQRGPGRKTSLFSLR